jgi:poly(hydroxyalkanoate) granule-associated protein
LTTKKVVKKVVKADRAKGNGKFDATSVLRRPLLISVGALSLAEDQFSDLISSLTKRGEKTRKAGRKYFKKLLENGSDIFKKAEKKAEKKTDMPSKPEKKGEPKEEWLLRVLHLFNMPTREDIAALDKKVDALLKKVA